MIKNGCFCILFDGLNLAYVGEFPRQDASLPM